MATPKAKRSSDGASKSSPRVKKNIVKDPRSPNSKTKESALRKNSSEDHKKKEENARSLPSRKMTPSDLPLKNKSQDGPAFNGSSSHDSRKSRNSTDKKASPIRTKKPTPKTKLKNKDEDSLYGQVLSEKTEDEKKNSFVTIKID